MPRILILTANSKTTPLQLATEVQAIRAALGEHSNFSVHHENEVQGGTLVSLLIKQQPDILHFAGHGGAEQTISLRSGEKGEAPLSSKKFASILRRLPVPPKLLVLNACSTAQFSAAVKPYVAAFVGTKSEIGDVAALEFSKNFYTNLASQLSVSAAFELAKFSVEMGGHDGDMLELEYPENSEPENLVFYGRPEIMASLILSKTDKPEVDDEGDYRIALWLRGVDQNIDSVTYQVCHETFKNPFWEVFRARDRSFYTDTSSSGDVTVRAVAWSKEQGMGVECRLVSALDRHYGDAPPKIIAEVIAILKKN